MSFVEAFTNVVVGYGIALATQAMLFPTLGVEIGLAESVVIAAVFTFVSLVRSFLLRRLFEMLRVHRSQNESTALVGGGSASLDGEFQSAIR